MGLTGHLSDLSLSELIEFFCNQRKTGQLKVLYPQGNGYFHLQSGSVVDARIGVLRGIDAVYFALTLPNAQFEFGGSSEPTERTINQPWTQVVLEGLRRLDEGVVPAPAFPPNYSKEPDALDPNSRESDFTELENLRVPAFLTFISTESTGKRRVLIAGAVVFAVIASVGAIGVPAGWYGRTGTSSSVSPSASESTSEVTAAVSPSSTVADPQENEPSAASDRTYETALAAKRQRERDKSNAREEKTATLNPPLSSSTATPVAPTPDLAKPGPKKVAVTVTYDESGRVTQASGGDASAVRIARQKRFPAGKAGSATITIPIN
jgi:uncharacterized protein DUF4388